MHSSAELKSNGTKAGMKASLAPEVSLFSVYSTAAALLRRCAAEPVPSPVI
jgi:hypothetical protein